MNVRNCFLPFLGGNDNKKSHPWSQPDTVETLRSTSRDLHLLNLVIRYIGFGFRYVSFAKSIRFTFFYFGINAINTQ